MEVDIVNFFSKKSTARTCLATLEPEFLSSKNLAAQYVPKITFLFACFFSFSAFVVDACRLLPVSLAGALGILLHARAVDGFLVAKKITLVIRFVSLRQTGAHVFAFLFFSARAGFSLATNFSLSFGKRNALALVIRR